MAIIEANGVSKNYGPTLALNDFSMSLEQGHIFGLLGPNGAGKTTFVKGMLGLINFDSGSVKINGLDSTNEKSREALAYLPEKFNFFPYYTVEGVVEFYGKMQGGSGEELKNQCQNALEKLGIGDLGKRKISQLSKGQLQRVGLSNLLVGNPTILIIDEPFSGLDPIGIKELKDLLRELGTQGKTILINSHILSEMEKLCDQVAIVNKGKCLAQGKLADIIGNNSLEDTFYTLVKGGQA